MTRRLTSGISFTNACFSRLTQIVQYIGLVRGSVGGDDEPYGDYYTTSRGSKIPWYDVDGFTTEQEGGHGSHTAGTAAGATLTSPVQIGSCSDEDELGCVGGCLDPSYIEELTSNSYVDIDTLCPKFGCDGSDATSGVCLSDDTVDTLTAHGGVAPGAKISVFDVSLDGTFIWAELAGNGLWRAVNSTGSAIHSNSWGGNSGCSVDPTSALYDEYMFAVRHIDK